MQAGLVVESPERNKGGLWDIAMRVIVEYERRVVAELDALQTQVDGLKKLQAEAAAELDAMLPSILDRAFRGDF